MNNLGNEPYQTKQGSPFASGAYAPERYTTYGRVMNRMDQAQRYRLLVDGVEVAVDIPARAIQTVVR